MPSMTAPVLQASSQPTRFDPKIEAASAKHELDLKDVSISLAHKDILSNVHLKLKPGVPCVLHGKNGVGKSTVLRAIGERIITGIPRTLRILLLQQQTESSDTDLGAQTAVDYVVNSNVELLDLQRQEQLLQAAINDTNDAHAVTKVLKQLKREQLERDLEDAKMLADLRSGNRGKKARKDLLASEELLADSLASLNTFDEKDILQDIEEATVMLAGIQTTLQEMNASTATNKVESLLVGLGFTRDMMSKPLASLSGGWKMRTRLASVLFRPCDVLLLDEPTNFLDFSALLWLEDYLATELSDRTALLLVSHDRAFVDAIADEVLVMRDLSLERYPGNLSAYYQTRSEQKTRLTRMKDAQDKHKAHIEKTIANNVRAARESGDDKKLAQAASRKKKLNERMGMEVGLKGGRFKLNRDLGGYHLSKRAEIVIPQDEQSGRFSLDTDPAPLRFAGPLLSCEGLSFRFKKAKAPVFEGINITVRLGERHAILGVNGSGKSTLIECLVGEDMLSKGTMGGTVTHHSDAKIAYFSQMAVDQLPADQTALEYINLGADQPTRSALASLGLSGRIVSDIKISSLSGGQKVRVALAKILQPVTPHLLILDEVTTHLDADTVDALGRELRQYKGAVIVVSHDRYFVKAVISEDDEGSDSDEEFDMPPEGKAYWLDRGKLKLLGGGIDEFEERIRKRASKDRQKALTL